jgi:hypothetical protein
MRCRPLSGTTFQPKRRTTCERRSCATFASAVLVSCRPWTARQSRRSETHWEGEFLNSCFCYLRYFYCQSYIYYFFHGSFFSFLRTLRRWVLEFLLLLL